MSIETLFEPFVLSPLDHASHDMFVFFYLSFRVQHQDKALRDISRGVNNLILRIPFLAGEVAPSARLSGPQNVREVRPSTTTTDTVTIPMLQVKYHTSVTLDGNGLGKTKPTSSISYDPLSAVLPGTQPRPVVRFQANIVSDGIILTMAFNHLVFDGTGGGIILELLAESCRSQNPAELDAPSNERTPVEERYLREFLLNMTCSGLERYDEDFFSGSFGTPSSSQFQQELLEGLRIRSPRLSEEHIIFPTKKIDQLKQACNYVLAWLREKDSPLPDLDVPLPSFVSTNNVLTALLWRLMIKAGHISGGSSTQNGQQQHDYTCAMAVNLRSFFDPPVLESYMGNAATGIWVTVKSTDLLGITTDFPKDLNVKMTSLFGVDLDSLLPIAYIAYRIRDQLSMIDDKYVRGLTTFFKTRKDWDAITPIPADIIISSWRHLKTYELDFGHNLGHIVNFRSLRPPIGNLCIILPASRFNPGTACTKERTHCSPWEVLVTLDETAMENFRTDSLLRWALDS